MIFKVFWFQNFNHKIMLSHYWFRGFYVLLKKIKIFLDWSYPVQNFWQFIFKFVFYSRYFMWQPNENLILCTLYGMETDCNVTDTDREAVIKYLYICRYTLWILLCVVCQNSVSSHVCIRKTTCLNKAMKKDKPLFNFCLPSTTDNDTATEPFTVECYPCVL